MSIKYDPIIEQEISHILHSLDCWKSLFSMHIEYYVDGWAIYLREKTLYSRLIVIFKSKISFLIKSFEIHNPDLKKETYKELYCIEDIKDIDALVKELKEIIYGKDLIKTAIDKYHAHFS